VRGARKLVRESRIRLGS
jgi:exonuclease III